VPEKSESHEIDFVQDDLLIEAKLGRVSPLELSWFSKVFPKRHLTVINKNRFETKNITGVTIHDFLMAGKTLDFIQEWEDPAERYEHQKRLKLDY
jgi:hypothetical protein